MHKLITALRIFFIIVLALVIIPPAAIADVAIDFFKVLRKHFHEVIDCVMEVSRWVSELFKELKDDGPRS